MNVWTICGNLGRDAELRYTQGGAAVAGFSVAVKSGYGDKAQTIWVDCSIWGKQAEGGLIQYLKKGQQVALSGEMGTREHEGKTYITLRVATVTLCGSKDDRAASQPQQQRQAPQQQPQQNRMNPAQWQQGQQQTPAGDFDDQIPF